MLQKFIKNRCNFVVSAHFEDQTFERIFVNGNIWSVSKIS